MTGEHASSIQLDASQGIEAAGSRESQSATQSASASSQTHELEQAAAVIDQEGSASADTSTQQQSATQEDINPTNPSTQSNSGDLAAAEELKAAGNKLYIAGQYEEAWQQYQEAIRTAPQDSPQLATYWANSAACLLKLSQHRECVEACSSALAIDPGYKKALVRRCCALEEMDELDRALQDAEEVLKQDGSDQWAAAVVKRLRPVVEERNAALKDEMLGKLKELGSTLLGKFGLSLDNFKAEQDPASGGYSIKFQQ